MSIKTRKRIQIRILCLFLTIISIIALFSKVAMAESIDATAISRISQTVYTGPSTSYVPAGSISANEQVEIIEKEDGLDWYHIQYTVTSSGKKKTGYVPTSSLTSFSSNNIYEIFYNGGQATSNTSQTVWSCDNPSLAVNIGSIGAGEGITLLKMPYSANGITAAFIEYSTSSGTKRGYLINPNVTYIQNTSVARVTSSAYLYSWPSTSIGKVSGSVNTGEYVTIVCKEGDWVYVEYNTNNGRKRGYFSFGHLFNHVPYVYSDFYFTGYSCNYNTATSDLTVYSTPSHQAAPIDTIRANTDRKSYWDNSFINPDGTGWTYIRYNSSDGKWLSGYTYYGG